MALWWREISRWMSRGWASDFALINIIASTTDHDCERQSRRGAEHYWPRHSIPARVQYVILCQCCTIPLYTRLLHSSWCLLFPRAWNCPLFDNFQCELPCWCNCLPETTCIVVSLIHGWRTFQTPKVDCQHFNGYLFDWIYEWFENSHGF